MQFLSRDGNATMLPPLHCQRQKSIARVSVGRSFIERETNIEVQ
jgi:hypothetical protein